MKTTRLWTLLCLLLCIDAAALELAPIQDVELLDGPFLHAQQTNTRYLMALDAERLLAPFRREAGLPFKETYGNWESTGLDGHIGGHYLSALALTYAATKDPQVLARLDYVIAELKKCQDKHGDGYLGGIPDSKAVWQDIARGDIRADNFSTNERWVPFYNLHKTFAGLRDVYKYTGNETAREMLIAFGDWALWLTKDLSDTQLQDLLRTEHGGMNDVFVDLADITGNPAYLTLARGFSHRAILDPLLQEQDQLTGLHANTQIPKVIGFKRIADAQTLPEWHRAAEFFWETVVNRRSVAIGGNSVREHFHDLASFTPMIEDIEGPETCNSYNMLRLTQLLFLSDPQGRYGDYYERTLYNHILGSQHPATGGLVYFTPMRPNHYRVYSQVHDAMWCCVGSGIESHAKYAEFIYARDMSARKVPRVYINLFAASRLNWAEQGIRLRQDTRFPDEAQTRIHLESAGRFALHLRYPGWVAPGAMQVRVNGKRVKYKARPGEYLVIDRRWKQGDKVELTLPMTPRLEQLPDGSDYYAVLYGPIVLAAKTQPFAGERLNYFADDSRMGHIARGQQCPLEAAPFLLGNSQDFIARLKPVDGKPLTFNATGLINGVNTEKLELIPFFRLHESRYTLYWPYTTTANLEKARAKAAELEAARLLLLSKTIDQVTPGEQQPESDHFYQGEQSESGMHAGRHWRHTRAWFSYDLKDPKQEAKTLRITYAGVDAGRRFSIWINGVELAKVESTGDAREFFDVDYSISEAVIKNSQGKLQVKFVAEPGSIAGGIYGVRLLRE